MESNFELGKRDWFKVVTSEENDWLNQKLENDTYGIWYSVQFEGDASAHLWQTKTPPEAEKKYWGWLEKTKTGKSTKFKWDKQNAPVEGDTPKYSYEASSTVGDEIKAQFAIKAAIAFLASNPDATTDLVETYAKDFFHMVPCVAQSSSDPIVDTFGNVEVLNG